MVKEIVESALALSRAGQWTRALRLLDAYADESPASPEIRLAAATVALDCDWFTGSSLAGDRLATLGDEGWDVAFQRLRHVYRQQLVTFDQVSPLGELHVRWTGPQLVGGRLPDEIEAAIADALEEYS